MGLNRLRLFLQRHSLVGIDTSIFIYGVERKATYVELAETVFSWLERPMHNAVTSSLTMTECLVRPYREINERRVNEFFALLSTYPNLRWMAPGLDIAETAARIRAQHGLRTPDALQAATAQFAGARGFITNDPVFERTGGFEVLVFDRLLERP